MQNYHLCCLLKVLFCHFESEFHRNICIDACGNSQIPSLGFFMGAVGIGGNNRFFRCSSVIIKAKVPLMTHAVFSVVF